ncbi:MAG: diacylglycerol/lipid kinase family protein, partial [bacterium]
ARLDDGRLDAVCILDAGPLTRARLFQLVARGAHEGHERVKIEQGASFDVTFAEPVRYEVDGEVHRSRGSTLRIESVPRALDLFVPADA